MMRAARSNLHAVSIVTISDHALVVHSLVGIKTSACHGCPSACVIGVYSEMQLALVIAFVRGGCPQCAVMLPAHVLLTLRAASAAGELGSAEPMRSAATSCALPMTRMSNGSSAAASGSASGSESRSGAAIGPATHVSSDSSSGSPFEAVAVAPGILPGMPSTSNRVLEGLDSLSRIGVTPPPALGAEDDQSMKGLTAVRVTHQQICCL